MAKELTDQEADDMERQLNAHRMKKTQERNAALRDAAKPLIDIVNSDAFKELQSAIPTLETMAAELTLLPDLGVHVNALRLGLNGTALMAQSIPAEIPASEQIVDNP